jgi:hypothetical protein
MANPINGHEWDVTQRNDLQYACVFGLPAQRDCANNPVSCDCADADGTNNPLCQADTGACGKIQYRAKGYPGRRQLAVLRGLEASRAVAASICPANTQDANAADYAYRPALHALVERMRASLGPACWDQMLEPAADGIVPCIILEASPFPAGQSSCPPCASGRTVPEPSAVAALSMDSTFIENQLKCACQIPQAAAGAAMDDCVSSDNPSVDGWCYVDPSVNPKANPNLVAACPANYRRTIRFVGAAQPQAGTLTYLQCKH